MTDATTPAATESPTPSAQTTAVGLGEIFQIVAPLLVGGRFGGLVSALVQVDKQVKEKPGGERGLFGPLQDKMTQGGLSVSEFASGIADPARRDSALSSLFSLAAGPIRAVAGSLGSIGKPVLDALDTYERSRPLQATTTGHGLGVAAKPGRQLGD